MNSRRLEYKQMVNEILDGHDACTARGLPGLDPDEWVQLADFLGRIEARLKPPANHAELEEHIEGRIFAWECLVSDHTLSDNAKKYQAG